MWTAIWAAIAAVSAGVSYWIATAPRRRRVKLLGQIEGVEHELARALADHDTVSIADCNEQLLRLRQAVHSVSA